VKIFLSGANGYIGGELLATLEDRGDEVWYVTRADTSPAGANPARQLKHDLRQPFPEFGYDFDLVVHAAGANDVNSLDPEQALTGTVLTTRYCAEFAAQQRSRRLLYVSTFQVYGVDNGIVSEHTELLPRNDYALTHQFAEQWIEQYSRTYGLAYVLARPANIAGLPRSKQMSRWTLVPGCFCEEAVKNQLITLRSSGLQQRDFLALTDVARQLATLAAHFDKFSNGAVNICSGQSTTIREVAQLTAKRYEAIVGQPCQLDIPVSDASANSVQRLDIKSRYWQEFSTETVDSLTSLASCIDQTLEHLGSLERK
jgi:UDP-glucose 4-epimerase